MKGIPETDGREGIEFCLLLPVPDGDFAIKHSLSGRTSKGPYPFNGRDDTGEEAGQGRVGLHRREARLGSDGDELFRE